MMGREMRGRWDGPEPTQHRATFETSDEAGRNLRPGDAVTIDASGNIAKARAGETVYGIVLSTDTNSSRGHRSISRVEIQQTSGRGVAWGDGEDGPPASLPYHHISPLSTETFEVPIARGMIAPTEPAPARQPQPKSKAKEEKQRHIGRLEE